MFSKEKLKEITRNINEKFREKNVCAVCDQICLVSKTKLNEKDQLPEHFFAVYE